MFVAGFIIQLLTLFFPCHSSYYCAIAPLLLGTLAAAGGAAMNSIANEQNKRNAQYSMNLQKDLLDYQWEKFDSPKAQLDSYAKAGINPAVALGQGSMRGASPSANAPEVAQVTQSATDMANNILALSEAKKAGSEVAGIDLDNKVKFATLNDSIKAASLANKWTAENTNKVMQEAYNIQGLNTKVQEEINNLRKEGKKLDFENEHWLESFNAQMREYADKHNIDSQTFSQMRDQAPFILDKLKAESSLYSLDAEVQGEYKEVNAKLGVIGQVLNFVSQFLKKR